MDGQQIQSDSAADSPTITGTPTPVVARAQSHKMLLVAFILASLVIYIVSKLGKPTAGMVQRFEAAEKDYNLNK